MYLCVFLLIVFNLIFCTLQTYHITIIAAFIKFSNIIVRNIIYTALCCIRSSNSSFVAAASDTHKTTRVANHIILESHTCVFINLTLHSFSFTHSFIHSLLCIETIQPSMQNSTPRDKFISTLHCMRIYNERSEFQPFFFCSKLNSIL